MLSSDQRWDIHLWLIPLLYQTTMISSVLLFLDGILQSLMLQVSLFLSICTSLKLFWLQPTQLAILHLERPSFFNNCQDHSWMFKTDSLLWTHDCVTCFSFLSTKKLLLELELMMTFDVIIMQVNAFAMITFAFPMIPFAFAMRILLFKGNWLSRNSSVFKTAQYDIISCKLTKGSNKT